jgi:hypothetical protein
LSLDLLAVQDQITAKLNELPQDVYETSVPDNKKVAYSNNMFLPYIVVFYGDMSESPRGRGITSVRNNAGLSYAIVRCIAPTDRAAKQVAGLVRDKLTGFQPTDAGELRLSSGGSSYVETDNSTASTHYITEIPYVFIVNTVVS